MKNKAVVTRLLQAATLVLLCLFMVAALHARDNYSADAGGAVTTLSRLGSSGSEVRQIQQRLKAWGYYKGTVDGIYGAKTRDAVRLFQKKNGLTVDGVAGPKTLAAIGISSGGGGSYGKYSQSDYNLLARVISAEAKGEPYVGQVAVGAVVLNRIESPLFPDTIPGVIYQPGAFSCVDNGEFNKAVVDSAYRAAQDALNGWDPTSGSIYYYNPTTAKSSWIRKRPVTLSIGNHVFCK